MTHRMRQDEKACKAGCRGASAAAKNPVPDQQHLKRFCSSGHYRPHVAGHAFAFFTGIGRHSPATVPEFPANVLHLILETSNPLDGRSVHAGLPLNRNHIAADERQCDLRNARYTLSVLCCGRRRAQTVPCPLIATAGAQRKPGVQVRLVAGSPKVSKHPHLNPRFKVVSHAPPWWRIFFLVVRAASPAARDRVPALLPFLALDRAA